MTCDCDCCGVNFPDFFPQKQSWSHDQTRSVTHPHLVLRQRPNSHHIHQKSKGDENNKNGWIQGRERGRRKQTTRWIPKKIGEYMGESSKKIIHPNQPSFRTQNWKRSSSSRSQKTRLFFVCLFWLKVQSREVSLRFGTVERKRLEFDPIPSVIFVKVSSSCCGQGGIDLASHNGLGPPYWY